ncbi:telomere maintenance protein PBP2 PWA37_002101 [Arxiozyma heterogenica]|uniref:telomere maintenance protein PBP2 n=1 Tax=Arxiozyma heterogenica TaxID=278026 RepID=UPI002EE10B12
MTEENNIDSQPQNGQTQQSLNGGLKRKNENGAEEQKIEAGIKRVALNDDNSSPVSTTSISRQQFDTESQETDTTNLNGKNNLNVPIDNKEDNNTTTNNTNVTYNNDYVYLRMLCLVKDASVIVGPKGETINNIKRDTLTKINVSTNLRDVPERVLFVRGSCENVSKAYYLICKYLIDHKTKKNYSPESTPVNEQEGHTGSAPENKDNQKQQNIESFDHDQLPSPAASKQSSQENLSTTVEGSDNQNSTITVNLLIPHYLMGYVIGKNGSVLKEIEGESSVKLQASPHRLLPSTDRILRVTGSPTSISIATLTVARIINAHKDKLKNKKTIPYQPGLMHCVLGKFPFIFHPRMSNMTNSNNNSNNNNNNNTVLMTASSSSSLPYQMPQPIMGPVRYHNSNSMESNYEHHNSKGVPNIPMVMLIPSIDPQGAAATMIPPQGYMNLPTTMESNIVYTVEAAANATTFVPNMTLPNVRLVDKTIPTQPMAITKQSLYIDENFVGNVIGKEGKHINSIKDTTGCSVIIADPVENSEERKLTIEGTYMGVQAAIMLISNKIEMDKFNQNKTK